MSNWWIYLPLLGIPAAVLLWLRARRAGVTDEAPVLRERKSSGPIEVKKNTPRRREQHFYGATVEACNNACDAAKAIADKRYLAEDAPRFPLPDCDRNDCRCRMRPQDDRRAGYDRRGDSFSAYGNFEADKHDQKRSAKIDRRKSRTPVTADSEQ